MRKLLVVAASLAACHPIPNDNTTAHRAPWAAVFSAHQNFAAVLSPDGKRVLFRSDRGDVPEEYVADVAAPQADAVKLVGGPERVASAIFTRDGARIVFRKDTGADENFHIFTARASDGGDVVDLTAHVPPMWRDSPVLPRARPDIMVYGARKPTDYASSIFIQPLAPGGEPKVVYHEDGPGTIVDVDADASHALWYREDATGGHSLSEVDLATGIARPISPTDGKPAMLTIAAYSIDGRSIFAATDDGGETHVVTALDRETLARRATYTQTAPATAEIAAIVPSPRGDVVAIMVDAGNHSTVRLLDATTLAVVRDVDLPLGSHGLGKGSETRVRLGGGVFADDGAHFTLDVSIPSAPDDIYLVDTATAHATPLRAEPRRGLAELPRVTASIANVPAHDGLVIPTNTQVPVGATHLPVIVWLHGGPDASTPLEWNAWNRIFTAAGFAIVEPNIRGSTGFGRAYAQADDGDKRWDALHDLASVNAWLRTQPWCDPDRIAIAGGSFGGYYTLLALAHQPTLWSAGVDLAGPSNLTTVMASGAMARRYMKELGDPADPKVAASLVALSPIHAADKIVAPLLVYQGKNDAHVPQEHAEQIVAALRARHVRVDYMLVGDEGHTVAKRANEEELMGRIIGFLR